MFMSSSRKLSATDQLIGGFDRALRTLAGSAKSSRRPSPADPIAEEVLSPAEEKHSAGLMRVNHSGEVCAQALYQGQAVTAKLPLVREEMELAASEELDHLAWCEGRLKQLGSHTSVLNPFWYTLSFGIGAGAGLISDRVSLGFVAATEDQVCRHLQSHLQNLPKSDEKSREIVKVMLEDEYRHGQNALDAGGYKYPKPITAVMRLVSVIMTGTSYRI